MAGEPTAINGMDSACLPNLFHVLYFLNEHVGKGKPSPWLSDIWGCGISKGLLVDNHTTIDKINDHELYTMTCRKYLYRPYAIE